MKALLEMCLRRSCLTECVLGWCSWISLGAVSRSLKSISHLLIHTNKFYYLFIGVHKAKRHSFLKNYLKVLDPLHGPVWLDICM